MLKISDLINKTKYSVWGCKRGSAVVGQRSGAARSFDVNVTMRSPLYKMYMSLRTVSLLRHHSIVESLSTSPQ